MNHLTEFGKSDDEAVKSATQKLNEHITNLEGKFEGNTYFASE